MNPNTPLTKDPEELPAPQETAAPVATSPVVKTNDTNSRKKLILIIAGAVFVVLLASIAAFSLWYNKPENVVSDSFMKALTAKTSEGSLSLVLNVKDTKTSVIANYLMNQNNEASGKASVEIDAEGPAYTLSGDFAVDKGQTMYVKVDNVRKALEAMVGSDPSAALYLQMFEGVITSVEGKWISVSQKDLQELSGKNPEDKELSCVQGKVTEFQKTKSQQNELRSLYDKHQFIKVAQKGTETIDGVYSNHYVLTPDEAKTKEFFRGVKSLTVFKNIDGCVADDLAKQVDDGINEKADDSTKTASTIDYWVGVWSHEPVKLLVNTTEGEQKSTLEFKPKLNTNPSVTIPKADKSIIELQQELMSSTEALYGGMLEPAPLDNL